MNKMKPKKDCTQVLAEMTNEQINEVDRWIREQPRVDQKMIYNHIKQKYGCR